MLPACARPLGGFSKVGGFGFVLKPAEYVYVPCGNGVGGT